MAKEGTIITISPLLFTYGNDVIAEDTRDAIRAINYAYGMFPTTHLSINCGNGFAWQNYPFSPPGKMGTLYTQVSSSAHVEFWETDLYIHSSSLSATCYANFSCSVGDTMIARFDLTGNVGNLFVALTATSANNNEERQGSFNWGSIVSGSSSWVNVRCYARRSAGSSTGSMMRTARFQDNFVSASLLPSPMPD